MYTYFFYPKVLHNLFESSLINGACCYHGNVYPHQQKSSNRRLLLLLNSITTAIMIYINGKVRVVVGAVEEIICVEKYVDIEYE